jgi:hypothetical protein
VCPDADRAARLALEKGRKQMLRGIAPLLLLMTSLFAQNRVSPEMMYHRVWAVVPMIGKGTLDDPRRPMFVPSRIEQADRAKKGDRTGVIGFSMQISDDGNSALVEFIGATPADLKFIVNSNAPGVKAFERGAAKKEDIEAEFKKYKATFKLDSLTTGAPLTAGAQ